jgi:hypothetical protein
MLSRRLAASFELGAGNRVKLMKSDKVDRNLCHGRLCHAGDL